jgi:hypothetical protein
MVYIPGLGGSSFPGGLAGVPGPAGPAGADGADGSGGGSGVSTAGGRLTTVSNTPILTTTQLAKTILYYTPFTGNQIALYSGGAWSVVTFAETSLSLSGYTASRNYDIWGYNNAGSLALESTIWTNDTTRATALTTQDGIYCKTGDTTRRYLGTVRINATGGQIDWVVGAIGAGGNEAKFTIWNENNRVLVSAVNGDSANSWTHGNDSTWSAASSTVKVSFVLGRLVEQIEAEVTNKPATPTSTFGSVAVGLNSTSTPASNQLLSYNYPTITTSDIRSRWVGLPTSAGFGYVQALDYSQGGISTFYGDNNLTFLQTGMLFRGWF